jgi:hypothetical protein
MMNGETGEQIKDLMENKSEGFKFAVAIIIAFSTVGYHTYEYIKTNPITQMDSYLITFLLLLSVEIILLLLVYLTVKGLSFETYEPVFKRRLEIISSDLYSFTLEISVLILVLSVFPGTYFAILFIDEAIQLKIGLFIILFVWIFVMLNVLMINYDIKETFRWKTLRITGKIGEIIAKIKLDKESNCLSTFYALCLVTLICPFYTYSIMYILKRNNFSFINDCIIDEAVLCLLLFITYYFAKIRRYLSGNSPTLLFKDENNYSKSNIRSKNNQKYADKLAKIFCFLIVLGFIGSAYSYVVDGDIKVTMDDVNNNNITHMPIQIVTTGLSSNMTINLTQINIQGDESILDSIEVHPIRGVNELIFAKYLQSSTLDYGKYKVFIDTTNLTQGYYSLSFSENSTFRHPATIKAYRNFYLTKKN